MLDQSMPVEDALYGASRRQADVASPLEVDENLLGTPSRFLAFYFEQELGNLRRRLVRARMRPPASVL
jgi:hypothetical protein